MFVKEIPGILPAIAERRAILLAKIRRAHASTV